MNTQPDGKPPECPGCGNTGLDSSHSWCQVCGGDSAIALQTIRHAFIAGAESKHPQGYRVGGYVFMTPDDAADAYLQHANVSGATRTDSVVAEGVTAGETAPCAHVLVSECQPMTLPNADCIIHLPRPECQIGHAHIIDACGAFQPGDLHADTCHFGRDAECDCQQETPEQEIKRVRESAGRTIGELRNQIDELKRDNLNLRDEIDRLRGGDDTSGPSSAPLERGVDK